MDRQPGPRTGAATRARLLEAGFALFTTTGYLRTTTPALAAHAGIAEGTIYRHFRSKEALLTECHRQTVTWALEALKGTEGERGARTPERLTAFAGELVARATEHPATIRVLFAEDHEPFLDDPTRALRRAFGDALVQVMAMGKSDGLVRSGPAEVWAAVWLAVIELGVGRVAAGDWAPDSGNLALTINAAWDAIAAPERPSAPPG